MLRAAALPGAALRAQHERHAQLAAGHRVGVERGWFSAAEIEEAQSAALEEVEAAVEFARASPWPDPGLTERLTYA